MRSSRLIQRRHRAPSEWEARAHFIFPRLTVLRLSVSIFKVVRGKQGKGGGSLGEGDDRLSGNSRELGVPLKTLLTGSVASRGKAGGWGGGNSRFHLFADGRACRGERHCF